jgi:hypothetical protein
MIYRYAPDVTFSSFERLIINGKKNTMACEIRATDQIFVPGQRYREQERRDRK